MTRDNGSEFELVREAVRGIRQIRAQYDVPPSKPITGLFHGGSLAGRGVMWSEAATVERMTRCRLTGVDVAPKGAAAHLVLSDGLEIIVPLAGLVDVEKERAKLQGEVDNIDKQLTTLRERLSNENFLSRAKAVVVQAERVRELELTTRRDQLAAKMLALRGIK